MWIFKLFRSVTSWVTRRIFPENLRPDFIMYKFRLKAEELVNKLDKIDEEKLLKTKRPKTYGKHALHILLLVGIVVGLWWLNGYLDLDKVLRSPWPVLHHYWLPILFLLGYALYWLGWWLWILLGPDKSPSEFPDIDEAWDEATTALRGIGININQAPLFLVLGRPGASSKQLFDAAQMIFQVRHIPRRNDSPLHITASTEGIFVTCEGASLLGRQVEMLLDNAKADANGQPADEGQNGEIPDAPVFQIEGEPPLKTASATAEETTGDTDTEAAPVMVLADEATSQALRLRKHRVPLLKQTAEVERLTARLQHLCRLIVASRQPYCSVNGILVTLPLASTNSVEEASQTGVVIHHDLTTARAVLQVHCPVQVVLTDMETVPGFCEMLENFPEAKQRQFVLGQPFPLVPDLEKPELPKMIDRGVRWLFETLFPSNIYKLLHVESPAKGESRNGILRNNGRLYTLLVQMGERHKRLNHILMRGLTPPEEGHLLFGGVFLAATGPDAAREQAFVHGVFRQLIESQNYVSWTKEAVDEEAAFRKWARLGYVVILLIIVAAASLAYVYWPRY
ncbi:MAG: hypothetical protein JNM56_32590 [Planctomycetia bacterium]|nr:hypothetical protein [Planctomycetia bacterium]